MIEINEDKIGEFFLLFSNCIPVKGASRSVIVDTQREEMFFIPNEIHDLIKELKEKPFDLLLDSYNEESAEYIHECINYLKSNELGFWTDTPSFFSELDLNWDSPSIITNAIIDVKHNSVHPWKKIFDELEDLGCKDLQLRFYDSVSPNQLSDILLLLDKRRIKSVEIILKFDALFNKSIARALTKSHHRIRTLFFHSSIKDEVFIMNDGKSALSMGNIVYLKEIIDSNSHCGVVGTNFFAFGISSFTEAINFNSCLNRKVSIDHNGDIKNCPTLSKVYGNIRTHKISEILDLDFTKIWHVNKNQINVCKDCEFRYVCTDCRGFLVDDFAKPKKCTYNPYTTEWA